MNKPFCSEYPVALNQSAHEDRWYKSLGIIVILGVLCLLVSIPKLASLVGIILLFLVEVTLNTIRLLFHGAVVISSLLIGGRIIHG